MRNTFFVVAGAALFITGGGVLWLRAQAPTNPTITAPRLSSNLVTINTPTQIIATVAIPDPTLNPTTVELIRIDPGNTGSVVAQMLDDGHGADQKPGDRTFTASFTLNENQAGEINFRVSAAFKGILTRFTSAPSALQVWNHLYDYQSGLDLRWPPLISVSRASLGEFNGERFISIEILDPRDNNYKSVFSALLYKNPNHDPLTVWFHNIIDPTGILLNTATYIQKVFSTGVIALNRSAPLPDAYLQNDGPIADIFAMKPNGSVVIGLIQSQDVELGDFGYSKESIRTLFQNIAENLSQ